MTSEQTNLGVRGRSVLRTAFSMVVIAVSLLGAGYTAYRVLVYGPDLNILHDHWIGICGPIFAGFFALFVVVLTKYISGELKIEIGEIKISGAASESLFWVINFLAIVWSFSTLWPLKTGAG